jgi:hypothetical protein
MRKMQMMATVTNHLQVKLLKRKQFNKMRNRLRNLPKGINGNPKVRCLDKLCVQQEVLTPRAQLVAMHKKLTNPKMTELNASIAEGSLMSKQLTDTFHYVRRSIKTLSYRSKGSQAWEEVQEEHKLDLENDLANYLSNLILLIFVLLLLAFYFYYLKAFF